METCDHCGRERPVDQLIPIALRGAASMRGHLVSRRGSEPQIMRVDAECFALLEGAPIGDVVDLREPPDGPSRTEVSKL